MKIAIKITVLAIVTAMALTVISCAPEAELTARDWKKITADQDTAKLSIKSEDAFKPSVEIALLDAFASSDNEKEIVIFFPAEADVLRTRNASILGKLQGFMQFYTYTKGANPTAADTLKASYDYTFVCRLPVNDGELITVRLNTVPAEYLVMKIDASKYTYSSGRKLGGDRDTKPGTPYYDVYETIPVYSSGPGAGVTPQVPFVNPYFLDNVLTIRLSNVVVSSGSTVTATAATLSLSGLSGGNENDARERFLRGLTGKLKLKKYGDKDWEDVSGTFNYVNNEITVSFSREEFIPYRVEADGVNDLTVNYFGVDQRVIVNGSGDTMDEGYNRKTVVSDNYVWVDYSRGGRILATGSAFGSLLVNDYDLVTTDREGKNAIIRVVFNSLPNPNPLAANPAIYLEQMDITEFKKNVKIVFKEDGGPLNSIAAVRQANDLCYIDIKNIEYSNSSLGLDTIDITIDPKFNINRISNASVYLLLAPGFKYYSDVIFFGNYLNWEYEIEGVKYFDIYDLQGGGGGFPAPTGLNVTGTTSTSVSLAWDSVSSAVEYSIYRGTSVSGVYSYVGNSTTAFYTDTGLDPSTTYYYRVSAIDDNDDEGVRSSYVYGTTQPSGGPSSPTPLSVDVWINGNLMSSVPDLYSFDVTSGDTYYIWWNDHDNSARTADIKVKAYYISSGNTIFDVDNAPTNTESFTASSTGTVYLSVYAVDSSKTGSYEIAYSAANTRPTP